MIAIDHTKKNKPKVTINYTIISLKRNFNKICIFFNHIGDKYE